MITIQEAEALYQAALSAWGSPQDNIDTATLRDLLSVPFTWDDLTPELIASQKTEPSGVTPGVTDVANVWNNSADLYEADASATQVLGDLIAEFYETNADGAPTAKRQTYAPTAHYSGPTGPGGAAAGKSAGISTGLLIAGGVLAYLMLKKGR